MVNIFGHVGRLGQDPEMKYFDSGKVVAKFTLAVGFGEKVNWFNYEAWGNPAETIGEQKKGSQISVSGYSKQEKWEDKDGNKRSKVVFVVTSVTLLGKKED